eukprot:TRINITY_DN1091_c0_g1_i6.p1 TRINITY_DN1091_c0_g1~~TRINITY_DN1091_c0_g1_i6.p1  ORF type:complete len:745 (+),score=162.34 TRINITY_DN1091_c0_g1_i6:51-2237(+)
MHNRDYDRDRDRRDRDGDRRDRDYRDRDRDHDRDRERDYRDRDHDRDRDRDRDHHREPEREPERERYAPPPAQAPPMPSAAAVQSLETRTRQRKQNRLQSDFFCEGLAAHPAQRPVPSNVRTLPAEVLANHFPVVLKQSTLYQYDVTFTPELDMRGARIAIMYEAFQQWGDFIFDGRMLFAVQQLQQGSFPYHRPEKHLPNNRTREAKDFTITLLQTAEVHAGTLAMYQAINILLRKMYVRELKLKLVGRNYFDASTAIPVPNLANISYWKGLIATLTPVGKAELTLNVDRTFKVIRTDTAASVLDNLKRRNLREQEYRQAAAEELTGRIVLTDYSNKTYYVSELEWNMSPQSRFAGRNNEPITFIQYYRDHYNIQLRRLEPPLLVVYQGVKKTGLVQAADTVEEAKIFLMPELCKMTGLSEDMRRNFQTMQKVSAVTRMDARQRLTEERMLVQNAFVRHETVPRIIAPFLTVSADPVRVHTARFAPEQVAFFDKAFANPGDNCDWSRDVQKNAPLSSGVFGKVLIVFAERHTVLAGDVKNLITELGGKIRLQFGMFEQVVPRSDNANDWITAIEEHRNSNADIALIILPDDRKDRYARLKQYLTVDLPIPSQMTIAGKMTGNKRLTVCTRLVWQMNCKLGGESWGVKIPLKSTMFVGLDVCHYRGTATLGFTATINELKTKYWSGVQIHGNDAEISTAVGVRITHNSAIVLQRRHVKLLRQLILCSR